MKTKVVRSAYNPEDAAPLTNFDPFVLAKQFDAMVGGGGGGPSQFSMPEVKPIEYGGNLAGPAAPGYSLPPQPVRTGGSRPSGPGQPGGGPSPSSSGWQAGATDWGSKTAQFRQQFGGLRHTSGYRSPEHNARTPGASKTSYHMQRDAQGNSRANDYVGTAREMAAGGAWAKQNGAKEVLVHNAGTGQHLHIAW